MGTTVTTRGIVTAAYPTGGFFGFYIQTPGTGAANIDLATHTASDAVFVRQTTGTVTASPGSYVEVTGTVAEFAGATQVEAVPAGITVVDETVAPVVTTHDRHLAPRSGRRRSRSRACATARPATSRSATRSRRTTSARSAWHRAPSR